MKIVKQLLITVAVLLCSATMYAYDFEVDGIYYNITSSSTAVVTYGNIDYSGEVIIPSTVNYNGDVYSVTSIGMWAFSGCSSLTNVIFGENSQLTSIGNSAFRDCTSLASIEIPNSVTSIEQSAFYGCTSLANVIFEEKSQLASIGGYAFGDCSSLTNVIFGENSQLTSIGHSAFRDCTSLASIEIPNSVTSIGHSAFSGCSSLSSIEIPNSITIIEESVFESCSSLSSITIGYSVENIGEFAFSGCSSLSSIYMTGIPPKVGDNNFTYAQYMNTTLYVPEGLIAKYQSAEVWENFVNIKEYDSTGMEDINMDNISIEVTSNGISLSDSEGKPIAIYSINGILVKKIDNYTGEEIALNKGVYIVCVGDKAMKIIL